MRYVTCMPASVFVFYECHVTYDRGHYESDYFDYGFELNADLGHYCYMLSLFCYLHLQLRSCVAFQLT